METTTSKQKKKPNQKPNQKKNTLAGPLMVDPAPLHIRLAFAITVANAWVLVAMTTHGY